MHAKTDSEVTSLAPSSPGRSPGRRPAYYVQSPSHDDNKTATSFHSSPSASPPRHYASSSHHSSSTRFSASLKASATTNHNAPPPPGHRSHVYAIEEDGLLDDDDDDDQDDRSRRLPRRFYYLAFLLGFFLLFTLFSLVLWGASRHQKPHIVIKRFKFSVLNVQAGTDATGVQTDMADVNSTVSFSFRNRGTFFGLHVTSTPVELLYSRLTLATGNMDYFYQRRKSKRNVKVVVTGSRVPLYGSGTYLSVPSRKREPSSGELQQLQQPVPLTLRFRVRARAYVLGKLVKTKFYIDVNCSFLLHRTKLTKPISLKKHCHFH